MVSTSAEISTIITARLLRPAISKPGVDSQCPLFVAGPDFWQWIIDNRGFLTCHFVQPTPTAGDQRLALANVRRIEHSLVERAFDHDRRKIVVHNKLRESRIAADVSLWRRVERLGINHADHVAQIEIALGDLRHVGAADVAHVSFITFGHGAWRDRNWRSKWNTCNIV